MNLKAFVDSLTDEERTELIMLLNIKDIEDYNDGKDIPINSPSEPTEEDFLKKNNPNFSMFEENDSPKKRGPVRASSNTWEDTGEDRHIETPEIQPTARKRKPAQTKSVSCHVCGKSFNVNPHYSYGEFHRCNRCSGNK